MKCLILPIEKAQALAEAIAALPIPYASSRPIMRILEEARIGDVDEPEQKAE